MATPIMGLTAAMEEQKANGADIDKGSISGGLDLWGHLLDNGKEITTTIQSVLDSLMPGLVPLLLTFLCMYLLKKKANSLLIIFGLFGVWILGVACGVLQ